MTVSRPSSASRRRLLRAALPLFAAKGFAKTSTREVAAAAGVNLAAISYYFGDKAGLYRAVYNDPLDCGAQAYANFAAPELSLREALGLYLRVVKHVFHGAHGGARHFITKHGLPLQRGAALQSLVQQRQQFGLALGALAHRVVARIVGQCVQPDALAQRPPEVGRVGRNVEVALARGVQPGDAA